MCVLRRKKGKQYTYLYAYARIGNARKRLAARLGNDGLDYEKSCEFQLCKLLFLCLKSLTGISPAWGLLTGIRPVKRVNLLLNSGKSREEIFSFLKEKYLVKGEKLELAYRTATTQAPLLTPPKNSFSLYVSIPFCPTRCSYCSFVSSAIDGAAKLIPEYLDRLCDEIRIVAKISEQAGLTADTVYFGGGTPTALEAGQLARLMKVIEENFNLSCLREYTVEAGRADTITAKKLLAIKEGCERVHIAPRISINPQTMNDDVLRIIGREAYANDVRETFALARSLSFGNINMDLIAGLPSDSFVGFTRTLAEVIALSPENITVHTLTLKRAASLFRSDEARRKTPIEQMVSHSSSSLMSGGYSPYYLYRQKNTLGNLENVGYAKPGFESLYNIYIMEEVQSILAVGAGASTKLCDKNGRILRSFNHKFPYEYLRKFDDLMARKREITEFYL